MVTWPLDASLLLTHSATLFTIFEADVTTSDLRATRQLVTGLIGRELNGVGHQMLPRLWWTSVIAAMLRHTSG